MQLLFGLGVVVGIIWVGLRRHVDPRTQLVLNAARLRDLKQRAEGSLTLDEAEDGAVLARHAGDPAGEKKFLNLIATLKPKRSPL